MKKSFRRFAPILIVLASLLPYLGGLDGDFVFDDINLIRDDPFYSSPATAPTDCWKRCFWPQEKAQGQYRPLTLLSYWVNVKIAGMHSPAFRIGNIILHIAVTYLAFRLLLLLRFGFSVAFISSLIFAVHPLHSEAVIPAFGRGELLCAFFILSGLIIHVRRRRIPGSTLLLAICMVLAFWSKESGLVLLPLCLAYDWYSGRIPELNWRSAKFKRFVSRYLFYAAVIAAVFVARFAVTGSFLPSLKNFEISMDNPLALCSDPVRIVNAVSLQGYAIAKFIWPESLSHDYSYAQIVPVQSFFLPGFWLTLIGCAAVPIVLCVLRPALKRKIIFLCAVYLISILPASNIITPTGTVFGERLFYFPSIWLCCLASIFLCIVFRRVPFKLAILILCLILLAMSFRTIVRSFDWKSQANIVQAGISTAPMSIKTWHNLAVELADLGKYDEAVAACGRALEISPESRKTLEIRGSYFIRKGDFRAAEKDFRKIISLGTRNPSAYNRLGAILAERGEFQEAEDLWHKSLELSGEQANVKEALQQLESDKKH